VTALLCAVFFFFFQAEDGIRDSSVTGVQTCALPISTSPHTGSRSPCSACPIRCGARWASPSASPARAGPRRARARSPAISRPSRSEERRVGKECSSLWWPSRERQKRHKERREYVVTE